MARHIVLATLALTAVVMAGPGGHGGYGGPRGGPRGGHGGPGHQLPPFLATVSAEGRKEFQTVFKNESLTIAEIDTQVAALAQKYNVSEIYNEFQANVTAHLAEVKKNTTEVISNLPAVVDQLSAIFTNKNQTRKEQREAVEALRKAHPVEVDTIRMIRSRFEEKKGRRGPHGPRGGPRRGRFGTFHRSA